MRSCIASGVAVVALLSASASATGLDLGLANDYAVVALGNGRTFAMNSGPLTGNVLAGNNVGVSTSGGGNGQITGIAFHDSTVAASSFNGLQFTPTTQLVSNALTGQAFADAVAVSNYASSLTATQSFGSITSTTIINGNGGLNVISIASLQNANVTINGTANDTFVFNVAGNFSTNRVFTLSGGVSASNLLFNLTGTSGNIFQTSGGAGLVGTFLATRGGNFQFSNLVLDGALINTAGNIQFVSGSTMSFNPFIPTPGSAVIMATAGVICTRRRRYAFA